MITANQARAILPCYVIAEPNPEEQLSRIEGEIMHVANLGHNNTSYGGTIHPDNIRKLRSLGYCVTLEPQCARISW